MTEDEGGRRVPSPEDLSVRLRAAIAEKEAAAARGSYAARSTSSRGRREALEPDPARTSFARDRDRIMYASAFYCLAGKSQVFMSPRNPLISNRLTHTIQVAQIARTIARAIDANEDLAEAIAFGHDLGHPPFGHKGERQLDALLREHGLAGFRHNVHSLHVVDVVENGGKGLNLSLEVREGIVCHDGDVPGGEIVPDGSRGDKDPAEYDADEIKRPPSTIEGCIVRLCDKIAYAGKDLEDAISAGIVRREDAPRRYTDILGETNGQIIGTLVWDIVSNFWRDLERFRDRHGRDPGPYEIGVRLSAPVKEAMDGLIFEFNYPKIYESEVNDRYDRQTERILRGLFLAFVEELRGIRAPAQQSLLDVEFGRLGSDTDLRSLSLGEIEDRCAGKRTDKGVAEAERRTRLWLVRRRCETEPQPSPASVLSFLAGMNDAYVADHTIPEIARDYLASLTDKLAIDIYEALHIPRSVV